MKNKAIVPKILALLWIMVAANLQAQPNPYVWQKNETVTLTPEEIPHTTLYYEGDFTDLEIKTVQTPRVEIKARIEFPSKRNNKTEVFLREFDLKIDRERDRIVIKTAYPPSQVLRVWGKSKPKYKVTLLVPDEMPLHIQADYSEIIIDDRQAPVRIWSDFSHLKTGYIHGNNSIHGDYLHVDAKYFQNLTIRSDFSNYNIGLNFNMLLEGDYNNLTLKRSKRVRIDGDVLNLTGDRIYGLSGDGDKQNIHIKRIYLMNYDGDFNNYIIDELPQTFRLIELKGNMASTIINNPKSTPFRFIIQLFTGELNANGLTYVIKKIKPLSRYYEGYYGNPRAKGQIHIEQHFSTVTINNPN